MNRKRAGLVGTLAAIAVALASRPALAQTADSTTEKAIWGLNFDLLAIAIPITILVEVILLYTVWRFRASNVEEASPTRENRRLEITWSVATAVVLLFVGIGAYTVLGQAELTAPEDGPEDALNVQVEGQQFFWQFEYPDHGVSTDSNTGELVVPRGRTVRFNVSSRDVLHAFHVPGLGLKADAFPGRSNQIQTTLNTTGTYQLYCAEYCGTGHSQMLGVVNVTSQETFEAWVEEQQGS